MWDYGKEITVTLEDALFSAKSMAVMFGNGTADSSTSGTIKKTIKQTAGASGLPTTGLKWTEPDGREYAVPTNATITWYDAATGDSITAASATSGNLYYGTFDLTANTVTIDISPNSFPGTYYITGDTYARSEEDGTDEFFQFVIRKAKVQSENTITMEAEGDPSTFSMNLKVLRPASGAMMELKKYQLTEA